jgi:hypothetical protein
MPKAKPRRVRNRATVFYAEKPGERKGGRHITVRQTAAGRILHSTTIARKLETGTPDDNFIDDPWTTGFFDSNTEAFVVDSLPVWAPDELLDSDPPESQPEPRDRRTVRMSFTFECSLNDKNF